VRLQRKVGTSLIAATAITAVLGGLAAAGRGDTDQAEDRKTSTHDAGLLLALARDTTD
jgi:hypothetical protein